MSSTSLQKGKRFPQYLAELSVCIAALATGTILGWTANISEEMKSGKFNNLAINDDDLGWIGSFATLGAMFACFPMGMLCDWIGRKWAMLCLIVPFSIGWLLIIFSVHTAMIFAGRFITGFAGGAFCVSCPMYASEIAENDIRGALGSYFDLLLTNGILVAYVISYFVEPLTYSIILGSIPLAFGLAFVFQPDTPTYLMKKGRDAKAKLALRHFRGKKFDTSREIIEIKAIIEEEKTQKVSFLKSLKKRAAQKAIVVSFGLMFFQQMSGIYAVVFYTAEIFISSGSNLDPKLATILIGVVQAIATIITTLVVDKLGRKILLIASAFLMTISIVPLGVFFTLKDRKIVGEDTLKTMGFLPILSLCIFVIAFSIGFGPIPWMITAEVFPPEMKTTASAAACTFNWFVAFLVTKFYLRVENALGADVVYYIFGLVSAVGTVFCIFVVPETKGKSLLEIQRELNGSKIIMVPQILRPSKMEERPSEAIAS